MNMALGLSISYILVDIGGFDSRYYAGLNLVIIATSLLLPWKALHSALSGIIILLSYLAVNFAIPRPFAWENFLSNLFFMAMTIIMCSAITYFRSVASWREFVLAKNLAQARDELLLEIDSARRIQRSLLPQRKSIGPFSVSCLMESATEVGGDYYDVIMTRHGEQWVAIGDVSGHGVEAGLIMMMTQSVIYSLLNSREGYEPSHVLREVNRTIIENIQRMESTRYMTLMLARLDDDSITVSGRHQDVHIYRAESSVVESYVIKGIWIGIEETEHGSLHDYTIPFYENDVLLLFTDGIIESRNAENVQYGEENLVSVFWDNAHRSPDEIRDAIITDFLAKTDKRIDDYSLVVVKKDFPGNGTL